jgi:hypothetical protein
MITSDYKAHINNPLGFQLRCYHLVGYREEEKKKLTSYHESRFFVAIDKLFL